MKNRALLLLCAVVFVCCYDRKEELSEWYSTQDIPFRNIFLEVCPGQVWVFEMNTENPFLEVKRYTLFVLDVRGDYVQYKQNGIIRNSKTSMFKVVNRKIK